MYTAIILLLLAGAGFLIFTGLRKNKKGKIIAGILIGLFTWLFFWFLGFWGDMLWFEALGYNDRFWLVELSRIILAVIFTAFSWGYVYLLTFSFSKELFYKKLISRSMGAFIGFLWGFGNWEVILKFLNREQAGISDPILNMDAGFYLFTLPFLDQLYTLLIILSVISFLAALSVFFLFDGKNIHFRFPSGENRFIKSLYMSSSIIIIILALGKYLSRFHLLFSEAGVVMGPGWTDVNIKLPGYILSIIVALIIGTIILIPASRRRTQAFITRKFNTSFEKSHPILLISSGLTIAVVLFLALTAIPGLFQWLVVEPNEITYEQPYIENNISLTRYAFGLNDLIEREYPVSEEFTKDMVEQNSATFSNIRLWDWRALDAVYKQFQEIRLYYEFEDVDIDRYTFGGNYRQVMVSAREMDFSNLPAQSQTFVNQRFKYTHGYGITLTNVNEFTPDGLPKLLIKDIPPVNLFPELKVERPQIYYGELTNSHVIVNTTEEEFDYPSGEENIYIKYPGTGGVQISNIWRKFLFGYLFDGTQLFFSTYPTSESRIMYHRQIQERVQKLAPFLQYDKDPYIVLVDGKLYWIIDAYTTSEYFPYSEAFNSTEQIEYKEGNATKILTTQVGRHLNGINYIRNSVKVIVDAFNGNVDFYVMDEQDPLIKVWSNIFGGLFKSKDLMPENLFNHIRYPIDLLLVQGLVYAKYHMTDPMVFYNQEDLWIRATEKYYGDIQPVEPYYIMWELPDSDEPQFVIILPFTPKNRQVSIGWIAGMCDGENYGKFLAYKFPKDKRVLGPQQVETKIDQDSFLSGQLSLWDQRGSNVIRGNVLAIPVDNTLLYVEPIYLQAETAAYPELRLVVLMHNDNLSYAETFEQALNGLFEKDGIQTPSKEEQPSGKEDQLPSEVTTTLDESIKNANEAFENYLKYLGEKRFDDAARELKRLQNALNNLKIK